MGSTSISRSEGKDCLWKSPLVQKSFAEKEWRVPWRSLVCDSGTFSKMLVAPPPKVPASSHWYQNCCRYPISREGLLQAGQLCPSPPPGRSRCCNSGYLPFLLASFLIDSWPLLPILDLQQIPLWLGPDCGSSRSHFCSSYLTLGDNCWSLELVILRRQSSCGGQGSEHTACWQWRQRSGWEDKHMRRCQIWRASGGSSGICVILSSGFSEDLSWRGWRALVCMLERVHCCVHIHVCVCMYSLWDDRYCMWSDRTLAQEARILVSVPNHLCFLTCLLFSEVTSWNEGHEAEDTEVLSNSDIPGHHHRNTYSYN